MCHDIAMHLVAERFAGQGFDEFWSGDPGIQRLRDLSRVDDEREDPTG